MGNFPRDRVNELLVACHRRCCICHRFCGVKIETDHIIPAAEGGPDTIDNAIPVCFECHAEIHSYNDNHPRGRKFQPKELQGHKEQWLEICKNKPEIFREGVRSIDVGPLQALIDELEFNMIVGKYSAPDTQGCLFLTEQLNRAIREGAIALLHVDLKQEILEAYASMSRANQLLIPAASQVQGTIHYSTSVEVARKAIEDSRPKIEAALKLLLGFMASEK